MVEGVAGCAAGRADGGALPEVVNLSGVLGLRAHRVRASPQLTNRTSTANHAALKLTCLKLN